MTRRTGASHGLDKRDPPAAFGARGRGGPNPAHGLRPIVCTPKGVTLCGPWDARPLCIEDIAP